MLQGGIDGQEERQVGVLDLIAVRRGLRRFVAHEDRRRVQAERAFDFRVEVESGERYPEGTEPVCGELITCHIIETSLNK